jgi:RNA polymerase sigma-70 factor (ECF subfamily)
VVIDIQLIEAARSGEKESFAKVFQSITPDLYKLAYYTLGNAHDAEDAVSETFIEAYRGVTRLRDSASFKPWVTKILTVRCKRKIAQYVKNKQVFDLDDFLTTLSDEGDMAEDMAQQVTVMSAMARLSPQEREVVVLSVLKGYTTREIAEIMSAPQGTISSKLHRTLAKLRKMLEPD